MEAVVLAGGMGKRLKSVVHDVPKPMADINGHPFLEYLLLNTIKKGVKKFVLSTGYKHEVISDYFKNEFIGVPLEYVIEQEPLGTGGGIALALSKCNDEHVLILNGDTLFDVDMNKLMRIHLTANASVTLSLRRVIQAGRYGNVLFNENLQLTGFKEKSEKNEENYINGGVYIINRKVFQSLGFPMKFSFENDFLEKYYQRLKMVVCLFEDYFIDIGIPSDYEKAKNEFKTIS